jgi:hypothetical protein
MRLPLRGGGNVFGATDLDSICAHSRGRSPAVAAFRRISAPPSSRDGSNTRCPGWQCVILPCSAGCWPSFTGHQSSRPTRLPTQGAMVYGGGACSRAILVTAAIAIVRDAVVPFSCAYRPVGHMTGIRYDGVVVWAYHHITGPVHYERRESSRFDLDIGGAQLITSIDNMIGASYRR